MISNIKIKNVASYDNNGVEIKDLKKLNFFFGFNGSGKSTIANYLYNISLEQSNHDSRFDYCTQTGYDSINNKILVFNEDFVKRNFVYSSEQDGIFSLDEINRDVEKQIDSQELLKKQEENYQSQRRKTIEEVNKYVDEKEKELLNICFNVRNEFKLFNKIILKHLGNRKNHLEELRKCLGQTDSSITLDYLKTEYDKLYLKEVKEIESCVDLAIYNDVIKMETDLNTILSEVIVGNKNVDIAKMIDDLKISPWVESGTKLLDKTNGKCPFCQQDTIDSSLIEKFEKYFDKTYNEKTQEIRTLKKQYEQKVTALLNNVRGIKSLYNPDNDVSEFITNIENLLRDNLQQAEKKLSSPNEIKTIESISQYKSKIDAINYGIQQNNKLLSEIDSERNTLEHNIWVYMATHCKNDISQYDEKKRKCDRIQTLANDLIRRSEDEVASINTKIETLSGSTRNTQKAVESIKTILNNSGFTGFTIEEKEKINNISKYHIVRGNVTASDNVFNTLSEGERNFIAFLYFYQLCIGTNDKEDRGTKKKIIVIDDPVSSMDSQVLFLVATLIHNLARHKYEKKGDVNNLKKEYKISTIEQIFILTHNHYFYKEITLDRRPINTDCNHYLINKKNGISFVENKENHKVINDDYTLMWNFVKNAKNNVPEDKSQNISLANTMRRIIESYVNFIGLGNDCWVAVGDGQEDKQKYLVKCAFISGIHNESHKVSPLDTLYFQTITTVEPSLLFDVFESIFVSIGEDHYNMMMK